MPTKNPRLTITLQPSTAAQLVELSRLTGNSQSALIGELLESSGPIFDRMILVLSAAEQAKTELKDRVASDLATSQSRIEQQLGLVLQELDFATGDLLADVESVKRRAARPGRGEAGPARTGRGARLTPPSNRGVRSDPKTRKNATATTGYTGVNRENLLTPKTAKKPTRKAH